MARVLNDNCVYFAVGHTVFKEMQEGKQPRLVEINERVKQIVYIMKYSDLSITEFNNLKDEFESLEEEWSTLTGLHYSVPNNEARRLTK